MKAAIIAGCVVLSVLETVPGAHADGPKQTLLGEAYLNGLATGLVAASAVLSPKAQQELFCPPEKLTITGAMLDDIMRSFAKEHPELKSHNPGIPTIALLALRDTFPCKPQ
jgi:hypothetical protein